MKKKLLSLLLVCACVLSMTACGGNGSEETTEQPAGDAAPTEEAAADAEGWKIGFSLMTISDAVIAQTVQDAQEYIESLGGELLVVESAGRGREFYPVWL